MLINRLHSIWKFLLTTLTTFLVVGLSAFLLFFGILQLPGSKEWLADRIEQEFNHNFEGTLEIGSLDGLLPFQIILTDLSLHHPELEGLPVLSADRIELDVRLWSLLQRTITIQSLELQKPEIYLYASSRADPMALQQVLQPVDPDTTDSARISRTRFEWLAPSVSITDGTLYYTPLENDTSVPLFPIRGINSSLYLELSSTERFLDIGFLTAESSDPRIGSFFIAGQLFSDPEYLELNGFQVRTSTAHLSFTGEATPVDLFAPALGDQLSNATFRFDMSESWIHGEVVSNVIPDWPLEESVVDLEMLVEGTLETLWLDRLIGSVGRSSLLFTGRFDNLGLDSFRWQISLENLLLHPEELDQLFRNDPEREARTAYLKDSRFHGRLAGTANHLEAALDIHTGHGGLHIDGEYHFDDSAPFYQATARLDSLDISPLFPENLSRSFLDGELLLEGRGLTPETASGALSARLNPGFVNQVSYSDGVLDADWENQQLNHRLQITGEEASLLSTGRISKQNERWSLDLDGESIRVNPMAFLPDLPLPLESLTMEYRTRLQWEERNDLSGTVSFQIEEAIIDRQTLPPHQFYADLNRADEPGAPRQLRLTSTFLDTELLGDIDPENMQRLYVHWLGFFKERVEQEIVFRDTQEEESNTEQQAPQKPLPTNLTMQLTIKDLSLLRHYLPDIPKVESRSNISLNLNADESQMLVTGNFQDSGLQIGNVSARQLNGSLTGSFRYAETLKEYAAVDLQLHAAEYSLNTMQFGEGTIIASMRSDTLMVQHIARNGPDGLAIDATLLSRFLPDRVDTEMRTFMIGNEVFNWRAEGNPHFSWRENGALHIEEFILGSEEERIELNGIYSNNPEEEVTYHIRSLQLDRISDLIGGRVRFGGILNGDFNTRTLTGIPLIEGGLQVERGTLDGRLIGDVSLRSRWEGSRERFDTEIIVFTNPRNYPRYYERNNEIGQDLYLRGYFTVPDLQNPDREFFYFDADLREIDTWIATVIVPSILDETEGRTSGWGYVSGSLTDINFHAQFDIDQVLVVPAFLNTRYTTSGRLVFDRHDGLFFDNMTITDGRGGSGRLYGTVDLDNFSDTNYLDLTLDLQNLHFMNNPFDPDVPFYANTRGTGQARITGSNFSPYLRTTRPIVITAGSRISVPLLDETELQQSHSFIQFVDTFDLRLLQERRREQEENGTNASSPQEMTFTERFTLDLQFIADNPVNFQLVFDPVTNEILNANGTGQVRLTLEDQSFNLFGRMNISGGDYYFVAGDIISRRFQLAEGGSIIWEGDPANARLNVQANYRARPDLTSLLTTASPGRLEGSQRIPIDLVLNIGGTLSELENDFFFRVPSNIEGTLDPTMITQINALNRNEEEKVIQATSLLLSGNFIPLASASTEGGTGSALRETLTGGTVVNPLITSQVINPLLSDQINSLLRSDMTLDIDFNLTPYNQVDLGVALRLYDDRLILRRDGQITGPYSDIGDLGATYRINQTFALTAFHRQDPTLSNTSTTEPRQVQEMNGLGLEAQVQFNTWREFGQRVANLFNRVFVRKERPEEEITTQNGSRGDALAFD